MKKKHGEQESAKLQQSIEQEKIGRKLLNGEDEIVCKISKNSKVFSIIKYEEKYGITLGDHLVLKGLETEEECEKKIEERDWTLLLNSSLMFNKITKKLEKNG